jgi:hypothetical protein
MPGMTGMLTSCFALTSAVTSGLGPGPAQECGNLTVLLVASSKERPTLAQTARMGHPAMQVAGQGWIFLPRVIAGIISFRWHE